MIVRIFFRRILTPLLEDNFSNTEIGLEPRNNKDPFISHGVLRGAGRLVTKQFGGSPNRDTKTIDELIAHLNQQPPTALESVEYLSLERCNFLDFDLPDVETLVNFFTSRKQSQIVVNLSNNRIHGYGNNKALVEESIARILSNPKVKYLDLTMNPFCSVDKREWFGSVESELLVKLIWVPQPWLTMNSWTALISDRSSIWLQIRAAHEACFGVEAIFVSKFN
eukprot:c13567_g1_i2.p1 GENE.c13567_g1_i2~~c13567_g1_i2.p1  ORF type:complete len:223 (+),score=48.35 c13567_g1_i2:187-855(+)